jgi:hypothetical protein
MEAWKQMNIPEQLWIHLSVDDQLAFATLYHEFHHSEKITSKDRKTVMFHKDLITILNFLMRSPDNVQIRAIVTGVCFAGPVVIMDTRQLKLLVGRCKSSINGCFQNLGFVALRSKVKARLCVTTVLPCLQQSPALLRQWTARYITDRAQVGFVSPLSFQNLPEIFPEDLIQEKVRQVGIPQASFTLGGLIHQKTPRYCQERGFDLDDMNLISDFQELPTFHPRWTEQPFDQMIDSNLPLEWPAPTDFNVQMFDEITRN